MPNTLAHIGAQGLASRTVINTADLKWIYLGCIIPDIPWIMNRIVRLVDLDINLYDLRLYSIVQSSLLFSLILSFAFSLFAINLWKTFAILGANSLLHLLLDAMQIKWAVGVSLFAPFDWRTVSFNLFWPESMPTYMLTVLGIVLFVVSWKKGIKAKWDINLDSLLKNTGFAIAALVFLIIPVFFLNPPQKEDNHFVKTLRNKEGRAGRYIEMDRKPFDADAMTIKTFAAERINVKGVKVKKSAVLSIRGQFTAPDTILVSEYHVHNDIFRDGSSYVGLTLVLVFWLAAFRKRKEA